MVEVDPGGRFLTVNDRFCAITGFSREDLIGQNHRQYFPVNDPPAKSQARTSAGTRPRCNRSARYQYGLRVGVINLARFRGPQASP